MTEIISENDFVDTWGAKVADSGDLFTYEQVKDQPANRVWSIVEGNEDENWYALAGFHVVNMLGYVITDKSWETGLEQAIWFDADDGNCSNCGQPTNDGEGWDGLCGTCADQTMPKEGDDGFPDDFADGINGYLDPK